MLPEVVCLDDAVREYVRSCGNLLATFKTNLHDGVGNRRDNFALADVFGVDYLLDDATYAGNPIGSYLRCAGHEMLAGLSETPLGMPGPFLKVRDSSGQSVGWHTLPVTAQTPDRFVNWGSPPPGMATEFPAIHLNTYGKGRVVYIAPPVSRYAPEGHNWATWLIVNAIRWLHPEPRIHVEGQTYLEAAFARQTKPDRIIVHLLNRAVTALGGEEAPAAGARLRVKKGWFEPRQVREVWPEKRTLEIQDRGRFLEMAIPPVQIHTIITVEP